MATIRHSRHNSGFTLIEILVTIGLVILLLALVFYPVMAGVSFMEKGIARADAMSAARLAMDVMTRELAEAMYVFDPPIGGGFVAFLPARSSAPGQARTEQRAPIEPQAMAVRYWRALRDPARASAPFYQGGPKPWNPYYLARTEIPSPTKRDDEWNKSYLDSVLGRTLTRAELWYPDGFDEYPSGTTWPTAQPGYPWLEAVRLYPSDATSRYRWQRERAVGLTPDDASYDVPVASFTPEPITEEALVPWTQAFPRDYSRYRARYPLWANFALWDPAGAAFKQMGQVKVYIPIPEPFVDENGNGRWDSGESFTDLNSNGIWDRVLNYQLTYQTVADSATGHVWVQRVSDSELLYDLGAYPLRDVADPKQAEFALGIDYDRGEVLFDFPAEDVRTSTGALRYSLTAVAGLTNGVVVRGSARVWVEDAATGAVTYYVGDTQYHIDDATREVVFEAANAPAAGLEIHGAYRYRNNIADQLVVASYATKAIIGINLTVSKRDVVARTPAASRQDANLAIKVKLKNVPR